MTKMETATTMCSLQKSIRGSDVDAISTMQPVWIEAGDLPSLARAWTVIAYEDIGLANPDAQIHTVTALAQLSASALRPAFSPPTSSSI